MSDFDPFDPVNTVMRSLHKSNMLAAKDVQIAELEAENARLKAEVDALKLGSLLTAVDVLQFINLKAENERLRASSFVTAVPIEQYERLRKAGDAMASALILFEMKSEEERQDRIKAWSAAKEGKPSA